LRLAIWLKILGLSILAAVLVILLTGIHTAPFSVVDSIDEASDKPHTVYVVGHGWHTGVVIPADAVFAKLPQLQQRFAGASRIEVGWGDAGFYQNPKPTAAIALRAMFTPSPTVMHVVAVPNDVVSYFPASTVKPLMLSESQLQSLLSFVASSFAEQKGDLVSLTKGIYGNSQFYQATGSYYVMNTCNKWTAKALKSAGVKVWPYAMLTAESVLSAVPET